jgi:FMN-dependent NADH-azoreductase
MTVLKIDASARQGDSNSRQLGQYLAEQLAGSLIQRDVTRHPLPAISAEDLIDLHAGNNVDRNSLQQHLALSEQLIDELQQADTLIIATPMYNFGIPATLKQWIDYICRAGQTFKYTENGPVGLSGIKRAFIITATGGTPVGNEVDFVSGYLAQIARFIGVEEIIQIEASGSKRDPQQIIDDGKRQIDAVLVALTEQEVA